MTPTWWRPLKRRRPRAEVVRVVPLFLAQGGHLKRDAGADRGGAAKHPACRIELVTAVGEGCRGGARDGGLWRGYGGCGADRDKGGLGSRWRVASGWWGQSPVAGADRGLAGAGRVRACRSLGLSRGVRAPPDELTLGDRVIVDVSSDECSPRAAWLCPIFSGGRCAGDPAAEAEDLLAVRNRGCTGHGVGLPWSSPFERRRLEKAALAMPGRASCLRRWRLFPFRTLEDVTGLSQLVAGCAPNPRWCRSPFRADAQRRGARQPPGWVSSARAS